MMAKKTLRNLDELVAAGVISAATPALEKVAAEHPVSITPEMAALIDPRDPADPIAAQFVPSEKELVVAPEELADPIGDNAFSPVEGIVHRYPDRVLLTLLHTCPAYCRFCFRRGRVGQGEGTLNTAQVAAALDYIRAHEEIWEVVFSGGDPLMLSDRRLGEIIAELNAIEHVKVLRLHTRVPVVDPSRVTEDLIRAMKGRAPVYMLLHCNHARELTAEARAACAKFIDAGIPMLSQSVLLRGVNDSVEAMSDLMRAFVEARIVPHYLHHGDLAKGTSHFRVSIHEGQEILRKMRGNVSGMCQPSYILEIPGGHGKVPVGPVFASEDESGWTMTDFNNNPHRYTEAKPSRKP